MQKYTKLAPGAAICPGCQKRWLDPSRKEDGWVMVTRCRDCEAPKTEYEKIKRYRNATL